MSQQKTIKKAVSLTGIGVHSGNQVQATFYPAVADTGIIFRRNDIPNIQINQIVASWQNVVDTRSCTTLANQFNVSIRTVEHVMAALALLGIDNIVIDVTAKEMPILDGSAAPFVELLRNAGLQTFSQAKKTIRLLKTVRVQGPQESYAQFTPADTSTFAVTLDLAARASVIGKQRFKGTLDEAMGDGVAAARTFGFYEDAEKLWTLGLAKGASLENTVVIKENAIMNEEGLRFSDEFVRHKTLDAIGDMALARYPLEAHYEAFNPGHTLNHHLLCALFADTAAYTLVDNVSPFFEKDQHTFNVCAAL